MSEYITVMVFGFRNAAENLTIRVADILGLRAFFGADRELRYCVTRINQLGEPVHEMLFNAREYERVEEAMLAAWVVVPDPNPARSVLADRLACAIATLAAMTASRNDVRAKLEAMTMERDRHARESDGRLDDLEAMWKAEKEAPLPRGCPDGTEDAPTPLQEHRQWIRDNPSAETRWMSREKWEALLADLVSRTDWPQRNFGSEGSTSVNGVNIMVDGKVPGTDSDSSTQAPSCPGCDAEVPVCETCSEWPRNGTGRPRMVDIEGDRHLLMRQYLPWEVVKEVWEIQVTGVGRANLGGTS